MINQLNGLELNAVNGGLFGGIKAFAHKQLQALKLAYHTYQFATDLKAGDTWLMQANPEETAQLDLIAKSTLAKHIHHQQFKFAYPAQAAQWDALQAKYDRATGILG